MNGARVRARNIIEAFFDAFNRQDMATFFDLLSDDVLHDVNQGMRQHGKPAFRAFIDQKYRCYRETLTDIVILENADGTRGAAEFVVNGEYLVTEAGLPEARGQRYTLSAGAFFEVRNGKVARITSSYNLSDWIRQIVG